MDKLPLKSLPKIKPLLAIGLDLFQRKFKEVHQSKSFWDWIQ